MPAARHRQVPANGVTLHVAEGPGGSPADEPSPGPGGTVTSERAAVAQRLRPLHLAAFLHNVALWVPIEKLFMTEIGFDSGSVAVMAAAYAAVVPLLEVPSGVLADRWSRRGVVIVAQSALAVSALIGGLSTSVGVYIVAALFLGVFFAMQSGTFETIVYDTVMEEAGDSGLFERTIGRLRFVESVALVASALIGGLVAEVVPLRAVYFLTVPLVGLAAVALLRFREPQLHRAEEPEPMRRQVAATYRALLERGALRPVISLMVLSALVLQVMLEFGPLWMVDLDAPAALYGPHWAGLMAALGLGGLLGGRLRLTGQATALAIGTLIVACCVVLTTSRAIGVVIVAQVVLLLLVVAVSIPITARLHDAVSSTIRAGVASGVSTFTWIVFLPFALVFGGVSDRSGVHDAGWTLVAVGVATVGLLAWTVHGFVRSPAAVPLPPAFPADRFRPPDDARWPGHWARPPEAWERPGAQVDSDATLADVRAAIADLPAVHRAVIVGRDVEGRSPAEVQADLGLGPDEERALLDQARGRVHARLGPHLEGQGA